MGQFIVGFLQSDMSEFIVKSWEVRDVTRKTDISGKIGGGRKTDISVQIGELARARYIPYVQFGIWDISYTPIGVLPWQAFLVAYSLR